MMAQLAFSILVFAFLFLGFDLKQNISFTHASAAELCKDCIRIGILPLKYEGEQKKIALYAQNIQESLTFVLSSVNSLIVIDRTRMTEVMKEIAFQQSAYANPKTQVEMGKMLGVEYLYTGAIQEENGRLRIFIERIHVETGQIHPIAQVTGPVADLFALQDQLAEQILKQTQIKITEQEKQQVYKRIQETSSLTAYEFYARAREAYSKDDWIQAMLDYNRAIELDPQYVKAYNNRGLVYSALKEYFKAIADYNQALELDPKSAPTYTNRGNAYFELKEYFKAISDYNQALELKPKLAQAYYKRGNAYFELKDYIKAISDYNRAIELEYKSKWAYHNRGMAFFRLKDYYKAITDFNRAIELDPRYMSAYKYRALSYSELNMESEAIQDMRKLCKLGDESACGFLKENGYAQ